MNVEQSRNEEHDELRDLISKVNDHFKKEVVHALQNIMWRLWALEEENAELNATVARLKDRLGDYT